MKANVRIGVGLALVVPSLLCLGCAAVPQLLSAFQATPTHLEARGPGALFTSIDAAAVDALTYAYLQAQTARDGRMRGGTIYTAGGGYSYDEVAVAGPLAPHRISYALEPRDVARFHVYARVGGHDLLSERPTRSDRRSVRFVDPLHRPLYILHPSLVIRVFGGGDGELVDVADLRHPAQGLLIADE